MKTVKYVFITLKADNRGEGNIFSLYTLIRRYGKWLISVTLTMLMTTVLLNFYLLFVRKINHFLVVPIIGLFLVIETSFLIANLQKFSHGGYVTLLLGLFLFWLMFTW